MLEPVYAVLLKSAVASVQKIYAVKKLLQSNGFLVSLKLFEAVPSDVTKDLTFELLTDFDYFPFIGFCNQFNGHYFV